MKSRLRPYRRSLVGGLTVVAVLAVAGCSSDGSATASTTTDVVSSFDPSLCPPSFSEPFGATITIGASLPLTGELAPFGRVAKGMAAYVDMVNAAGGVKGHRLRLVVRDDGSRLTSTTDNVTSLVETDHADVIMGVIGTDTAVALRDELAPRCVPNVGLWSGSTSVGGDTYPLEVRGAPSQEQEMEALVAATKEAGHASIGLVYADTTDGRGYEAALTRAARRGGVRLVGAESVDVTAATDGAAQVRKLNKAGADVVVLALEGAPCPATIALTSFADQQLAVTWSCTPDLIMAQSAKQAIGTWGVLDRFDPGSVADASVPGVKAFLTQGPKYGLTKDMLTDGFAAWGWTQMAELAASVSATSAPRDLLAALRRPGSAAGLSLDAAHAPDSPRGDPPPARVVVATWNARAWDRPVG